MEQTPSQTVRQKIASYLGIATCSFLLLLVIENSVNYFFRENAAERLVALSSPDKFGPENSFRTCAAFLMIFAGSQPALFTASLLCAGLTEIGLVALQRFHTKPLPLNVWLLFVLICVSIPFLFLWWQNNRKQR